MKDAQAALAARMRAWVARITMIDRPPHEAYKIVRDDFYRYAADIEKLREEHRGKGGIKGGWASVANVLRRGMGECSMWVATEDCMDFFSDLHVAIYKTSMLFTD